MSEPRIAPLTDDQLEGNAYYLMQPLLEAGTDWNIFRVLANHPDLARRWMVFANHVLYKSSVPARERELAILRVGWLCQAEYEWAQHTIIGRDAGLTDAEIERIKAGPEADIGDAGSGPARLAAGPPKGRPPTTGGGPPCGSPRTSPPACERSRPPPPAPIRSRS